MGSQKEMQCWGPKIFIPIVILEKDSTIWALNLSELETEPCTWLRKRAMLLGGPLPSGKLSSSQEFAIVP